MNKKARYLALPLLAAMISSLTGCAYFNVGEEEFNCSGMPGSAYCHSTRDVYVTTNDGSVPSRVGKDGAYNKDCKDCQRSEGENFNRGGETPEGTAATPVNASVNGTGDEVTDNYVSPRLPDQPIPIRTPAVVMRIWVAPWIDTNDDLHAPGYVYTEIEPRRWIYMSQDNRGSHTRSFAPLRQTNIPNFDKTKSGENRHNTLEKMKEKQYADQRKQ